jgi:hypothetical protein
LISADLNLIFWLNVDVGSRQDGSALQTKRLPNELESGIGRILYADKTSIDSPYSLPKTPTGTHAGLNPNGHMPRLPICTENFKAAQVLPRISLASSLG